MSEINDKLTRTEKRKNIIRRGIALVGEKTLFGTTKEEVNLFVEKRKKYNLLLRNIKLGFLRTWVYIHHIILVLQQ